MGALGRPPGSHRNLRLTDRPDRNLWQLFLPQHRRHGGGKSEHATANAVDSSGLGLEDGRLINVKTHRANGGKEGKFLKRVHKGACWIFSVSLGPDYNAAHADHFHFDMGNALTCR